MPNGCSNTSVMPAIRLDSVDCAASEIANPATPAPVSSPATGTPRRSSSAMPVNAATNARKIFSKKRAIVWLVCRSSLFCALLSSRRLIGAARQAPRPTKNVTSRSRSVPSTLISSACCATNGAMTSARYNSSTRRICAVGRT